MKQLELDVFAPSPPTPLPVSAVPRRPKEGERRNFWRTQLALAVSVRDDGRVPHAPTASVSECGQCGNSIYELRDVIKQRWPEAIYDDQDGERARIKINLPELRSLLPAEGIPRGQLIEITGGECSGKTSVLLKALGAIEPKLRIVYVDDAQTFFPPAAVAAGVDISRLVILRDRNLKETLRTVELLLECQLIECVVFDFVDLEAVLPQILLHRLRQQIIRAHALAFFLTSDRVRLLPASLISLQLTVARVNRRTIEVTTTRSRITNEGTKGRMSLEAA